MLERENQVLQQQLRDLQMPSDWHVPPFPQHPPHHPPHHQPTGTRTHPWTRDAPPENSTDAEAPTRELRGQASAEPDAGPKLEINKLIKQHRSYGNPKITKDLSNPYTKDVDHFHDKPVITVTREFDRNKQFWRTCVEIFSPDLPALLKGTGDSVGNIHMIDGAAEFKEPFLDLFYNHRALKQAAYGPVTCEDLSAEALLRAKHQADLINGFMTRDMREICTRFEQFEMSDSPPRIISYADLWMLYKPGTVVYKDHNGRYEAFVVDSVRGMEKRQKGSKSSSYTRMDLTCFSVDYDGEIFGRVWSQHCIPPYHASKEITSLDLIPEKFLPDVAKVKESMLERGHRFWSLQGQGYYEYTGIQSSKYSSEEKPRVMVDYATYQRRNNWPISINRKNGPADARDRDWRDNRFTRSHRPRRSYYSPDDLRSPDPLPLPPDNVDEWSPDRDRGRDYNQVYTRAKIARPTARDEDRFKHFDVLDPSAAPPELALLLCPQQAHAYNMRDKQWRLVQVEELQPISFRRNAWDRLVLDAEYKSIIQAMVSSYVDKSAQLDDLVAAKGMGLTVLMHGPPGSGKTLTAECVAQAFSRPLYHVTCGDLGNEPDVLESRLEEIFDYAVTWNAILLLDEADIFLQDRDMKDLQRNALVSIFLRTLDYFSGILFLTTNRVTTFDQAFQSRVHVTLGVPALDQKRRVAVWDIFVDDLADKGAISGERRQELQQLVRAKWSKERLNGRQIRNAIRTALVVAEKKGVMLGAGEVAVVLRIGKEFEGYMGQGKGVMGGLEGFEEVNSD